MANIIYDPMKQQLAMELYMAGEKKLSDVAQAVGVSHRAVRGWHEREGWSGIRRQMRAEIREEWLLRARQSLEMAGLKSIAAQFEVARKIRERVDRTLDAAEHLAPSEIKKLAQALVACADVMEPFFRGGDAAPRDQRIPFGPKSWEGVRPSA